jgi:hypothetical protein
MTSGRVKQSAGSLALPQNTNSLSPVTGDPEI